MFCLQSCLPESLYQQVHHGDFASPLDHKYHQFLGVREKSIELFVLDEQNPKMNCFKICEKDLFFKIKGSAILKRNHSSHQDSKQDLIVLSLENETVVLLGFDKAKENFVLITHFDLSSVNANRAPIEKVGDRIKIVNNLILLCSYYRHIEVLKFEEFPSQLVPKTPIKVEQFISDVDFDSGTSTLYILCHDQALSGQINMHIQFFNKENDIFKYETSLNQNELKSENIAYKILAHAPDRCLTVSSAQEGLTEWNVSSLKKSDSYNIGTETVVDVAVINEGILLFLDDNSCLCFEDKKSLDLHTKLQISTSQKVINWSVFTAKNGFTYAFLNGHTGLEFFKLRISDGYIERIECILKENSYSNVVDSQFFPFAPIEQTIVSLSLKPESVDYNIWDSLSESYNGGHLINMISQTIKLPIIPIRSWLLKASNSVSIILIQTLQAVYVLGLKNYLQEGFQVELKLLSETFLNLNISTLHNAFNINETLGLLVSPSEVYIVNLQNFEYRKIDFSGKIDASTTFIDEDNFHLLFKSKDQILHYTLSLQDSATLSQVSALTVAPQVSYMLYFRHIHHYIAVFDYDGIMTIYDIKSHHKIHETNLDHVIESAYALPVNNKFVLGDRRGNVLIYNLIPKEDNSFDITFQTEFSIGEENVSLRHVKCPEGLFIYSENLFFLRLDDKHTSPYPVKYNEPLNVEVLHILDDEGPHIVTFSHGELRFFLADLEKSYRKIDFPLDNYLENFKVLKNEPDQIKRVLVDTMTSTINLITKNLHIITCDKIGRIISVKTLPNKKNTNNSFLVNAKTSSMTIQDKLKSFFIISFQNSGNYYLNFYAIEQVSDLTAAEMLQSPVRVRKLGASDILANEIITDAVVLDADKLMITCVGATLFLYGLETKEKDEDASVSFKLKGSKVFRYNFIQMEVLDDLIIVSDQNYGVNILKLEKFSLGESLGYKWEFTIRCVIPNKMPCDSLFLSKDEYVVINKFGELSVRHNRYTDYFHRCLEYSQGQVGDMCRRMLVKAPSETEKSPEIFIPGLKGGIYKVKKISQSYEKRLFQTLKFVEACFREILLYGDCFEVESKINAGEDSLMFDWKVLSLLRKESESVRHQILTRCMMMLPEDKRAPISSLSQLIDKFC